MNQMPWRTYAAATLCWCCVAMSAVAGSAPLHGCRVIAVFPHDQGAFTQGLVYADGDLYESTGNYGQSGVRRVDLKTGQVKQEATMAPRFFGEGLAVWRNQLIQLTWREGVGLIRDRRDLLPRATFPLPHEGWGITHDGRSWILSDGSADLRFMDPASKTVQRAVRVTDGGRPITRLNELEFINGEVWANIWKSDLIVRIAPDSGDVLGYVDLSCLWPRAGRPGGEAVLNGIAYDEARGRLFVTGKYWPRLYEIEVTTDSRQRTDAKDTSD